MSTKWVEISFPFNREAINAIKTLPTRKWSFEKKCWLVPEDLVFQAANLLRPIFPAIANELESQYQDEKQILIRQIHTYPPSTKEIIKYIATIKKRLRLPPGLKLFPFQEISVAFLELTNGNTLLGDDMGLGKGVVFLAWLSMHPDYRPVIAFVPGKLRTNWEREINKWLPGEDIQLINGKSANVVPGQTFYVLSYELAPIYQYALKQLKAKVVVLDECIKIANRKAARTVATIAVAKRIPHRTAISGSASLRNRPKEIFTTLNLLRPQMFGNWFNFAKQYCNAQKTTWGWDFSGSSNEDELRALLRPIMIRRTKQEVLPDLPEKRKEPIYLDVADTLTSAYTQKEREFTNAVKSAMGNRKRKMDYKDYLFQFPSSTVSYAEFVMGEEITSNLQTRNLFNGMRQLIGLAKAAQVFDIAVDFLNAGEKLVIFAHHKKVLDLIEGDFQKGGYNTLRIDGRSTDKAITRAVDYFQEDANYPICLESSLAGGLGLTLTASSNAIVVERQWSPEDERQAEDRLHRIGQKGGVVIWYLVAQNTIDDQLDAIVERKRLGLDKILRPKKENG